MRFVIADKILKRIEYKSSEESCIIPEGVEEISPDVFEQSHEVICNRIKTVVLPTSLKKISNGAFKGCSSLQEVAISKESPNKSSQLEYIGDNAFRGCKNLSSISIPSPIKYLGEACFFNCISLKELSIKCDKIRDFAFANTGLEILKLEGFLIKFHRIPPSALYNCVYLKEIYVEMEYAGYYIDNDLNIQFFLQSNLINLPSLKRILNFDGFVFDVDDYMNKRKKKNTLYANCYHNVGFNITSIKGRGDNDNSFKHPHDSNWANYVEEKQSFEYVEKQDWKCTGIGVILGFDDLRAIDVDDVYFPYDSYISGSDKYLKSLISKFLELLNLPSDYPWVVISGSGKGFHIIFRCKDFEGSTGCVCYGPDQKFRMTEFEYTFMHLELRWKDHLVLPPSLHFSGKEYVFRNNQINITKPSYIEIKDIDTLLNYTSTTIIVKKIRLKNGITVEYALDKKFFTEFYSYSCSDTYLEDSIGWLESSRTPEALNTLAIKYLFGDGVEVDIYKARELFEESESQTAHFNMASLLAAGLIVGHAADYDYHLSHITDSSLKRRINIIQENWNNNPHDFYLFLDTETTGLPLDENAPFDDSDNWPHVVQLCWFLTDVEGNIKNKKNFLIKPDGFEIPNESSRIHGITTEKAQREGQKLIDVLEMLDQDLAYATLIIGHNVIFDLKVLLAECFREELYGYLCAATLPVFCTMKETVNFCKIPNNKGFGYKYPKLQELYYKLFRCNFENEHNAEADIKATMKCFFELLNRNIIDISDDSKYCISFDD